MPATAATRATPTAAVDTLSRAQNELQLEPATFAGVILPASGQFLLLCLLQLWQQLQRCRQTRAKSLIVLIYFTSVLRKQFAVNVMFLREANSYKRTLVLRNSQQSHWEPQQLTSTSTTTACHQHTLMFNSKLIVPCNNKVYHMYSIKS